MTHHCRHRSRRRGAIGILGLLLLVPAIVLAAFVVNLGYILVAKEEMQKAADSAALAGASQLLLPQLSGNSQSSSLAATAVTGAVTEAQTYCAYNTARSVNLTLPSSDITVGYIATPTDPSSPLTAWSSGQSYPNAVQVTTRRDSSANNPLSLFMGSFLGMSSWSGQATATACASRGYTVTGFNSSTTNNLLLPIAVDVNLWNTFLTTGKSADGAVHDSYTATRPSSTTAAPNNVSSGGDHIPEFTDAYPNNNSPGNFGLVCIGTPSNDTPAFTNWIANGSSPSDMAYYGSDGIQATASSPLTMKGGPGLKSTLVSDLHDAIGQSRAVPLFSSMSGNGSNTDYTIVGFAGVTVVEASGSGSNIQLTLQPAVTIDTTATTSSQSWSNTNQFIYPTSPLALIR
jgi:Flp pilus assembly protein TadG